jgi:uncharacterized protein (DUF58 family)
MIWIAATLLLGGVGWWKSINLVLLIAYLMVVLLFANGFLARAHARRVAARRKPGTPRFAGEEGVVRVAVTNTGRRPATVTVEDRAGGDPARWLVHQLPPGATASLTTRRTFLTRGVFSSPVRVSSAYPFGLLQCDPPGEGGAEVVVLPAPGHADADGMRRWVLRLAGGDGRARKVLRRVTTDRADVRGVRPYRPGDPIRSIHWRSTARRRELMVREYDAAPAPDLVLIVEPWLPANPTRSDRERLEAALSLAATVALTWGRTYGTKLTVAVAGDPDSVRTTGATDEGVREALVPLAGVSSATTFEPFGPNTFDRSLYRATRLVISSRRDSPLAEALSRATGRPFVAVSPSDPLPWYQPPDFAADVDD